MTMSAEQARMRWGWGMRSCGLLAIAWMSVAGAGVSGCGDSGGSGERRDPAQWPFAASSPWNTPIGSAAQYQDIAVPGWDPAVGVGLNVTEWTHPVFIASESDPLRTFFNEDGTECARARVPDEAAPDPEEDAHLHVVDEAHLHVVETWLCARRQDGNFATGACVVNDLKDQGVYDDWHGTRAYGGSAIAGLIREGEITGGIRHALAASVLNQAMNRNTPSGNPWVWPASAADGGDGASYGTAGNLYMGSLLAIPRTVALEGLGLSPQGLAIGRALQDYGAYVTDSGGPGVVLYAEPRAAPELALDLYNDMETLVAHLKIVDNNTPQTPGGGGVPCRDPAPPFDR